MTEEAAQRARPDRQPSNEPALAQARWNFVVLCAAVLVLLATMLVARAELATLEARIFRVVNDLPQGLYPVVWPFMQYGTFITIPALALIALLFRRFRLALAIALAGVGVYLVALAVKGVVDRGRRPRSSRPWKNASCSGRIASATRRGTPPSRPRLPSSWPPISRRDG